ncbi:hypothetical protein [Natronobacterium texcoconense]|uniref:Uncharacterized protein n=1 Tax=Natronobacterium texcoconense TaxID=1095778 RepID=A0A1H1HUQ6_NATTX|nr:hypothetical protein [Natronobacterium texcoconense]SDR29160.1 hypothetical protein SAMN04489842_3065 [Natronobacterium texcoconense]
MNHLPQKSDGEWKLPNHAHVVVYDREEPDDEDDRGLLTIYDCGAAQKPPRAQLLGTLEEVDAPAEIESTPTGRIVKLRAEATLSEGETDRFTIQ